MALQLATIALPDDMQWSDEFSWLPTAQQVEIASSGALIVEESAQLAGRPITLVGSDSNPGFAWASRATIGALYALASIPRVGPLTLLLQDGRSLNVRFRFNDGAAVEAKPIRFMAPQVDADQYLLTLRLMQV